MYYFFVLIITILFAQTAFSKGTNVFGLGMFDVKLDGTETQDAIDFRYELRLDKSLLDRLSKGQWWQLIIDDDKKITQIEALKNQFDVQKKTLESRFSDKVEKVRRGDDLLPGVMKMVKVFVAVKRKLQPGDKMAGRHGNLKVTVENLEVMKVDKNNNQLLVRGSVPGAKNGALIIRK